MITLVLFLAQVTLVLIAVIDRSVVSYGIGDLAEFKRVGGVGGGGGGE